MACLAPKALEVSSLLISAPSSSWAVDVLDMRAFCMYAKSLVAALCKLRTLSVVSSCNQEDGKSLERQLSRESGRLLLADTKSE